MALMIPLVQQKKRELLVCKKKTNIWKFKANNSISWYGFCLGGKLKDFTKDEQSETSFNGTIYDFSVGHKSIKKGDILNIHQYLMVKNIIK